MLITSALVAALGCAAPAPAQPAAAPPIAAKAPAAKEAAPADRPAQGDAKPQTSGSDAEEPAAEAGEKGAATPVAPKP
jgi:hypothetical protein